MDMHLKTATKKLLKRPASESEGLAMALADDDAAEMEPVRQADSAPQDIGDRMADRLDKATDKIKPAEKIEEPEAEASEMQDDAPPAGEDPPKEGNDLF
jgi:recombinational DNA repair protein RecT